VDKNVIEGIIEDLNKKFGKRSCWRLQGAKY